VNTPLFLSVISTSRWAAWIWRLSQVQSPAFYAMTEPEQPPGSRRSEQNSSVGSHSTSSASARVRRTISDYRPVPLTSHVMKVLERLPLAPLNKQPFRTHCSLLIARGMDAKDAIICLSEPTLIRTEAEFREQSPHLEHLQKGWLWILGEPGINPTQSPSWEKRWRWLRDTDTGLELQHLQEGTSQLRSFNECTEDAAIS